VINLVLRRMVRRNQRGAVLVLAVPGLILALSALALSVDLGRQALEKRTDQKVADLASLDAVRDLANAQAAAEASARRNGFDLSKEGNAVLAERGSIDAQRVFSLDPTGDSVRVIITSVIDYIFAPGSRVVTARAVSEMPTTPPTTPPSTPPSTPPTTPPPDTPEASAGFDIGSTLASIDTTKAALLNRVLGKWLKGAAAAGGNADVVGWQGLLSSKVTMGALRDHLELLDAGVQFGTIDEILDAEITIGELAEAMGGALAAQSDADSTLYFGPTGIIAQATSTNTITLGDLYKVGLGTDGASLATFLAAPVNPFELLTGSAMVANGINLISVPDIGITIPDLGTIGLTLKVIEGKQTYIGPAGGSVSTSQVELTLTTNLNRALEVPGLVGARLTGTFPLSVTAAGGTGTLTSITCATAPGAGIQVAADLKPFSSSTSASLGVSGVVLGVLVPLFNVSTTGGVAATDPTPANLDFAYSSEFWPTYTGMRAGASPVNLDAMSTYSASISALGVTPIPASLAAAVTGELKNVTALFDDEVMTALHRTLGVSIGAADVTALKDSFDAGCAAPAPPPATTTTTAPTTTTTPPSTAAPAPKLVN
jgi:uncharacterized membrane protein